MANPRAGKIQLMADGDELKVMQEQVRQTPAKAPKLKPARSKAWPWIVYMSAIAIMALISTNSASIAWPAWLVATLASSHPMFKSTEGTNFLMGLAYYPLFLLPIYYWQKNRDSFWLYIQLVLFVLHFGILIFAVLMIVSGGPWVK